jgi:hypothetical protein
MYFKGQNIFFLLLCNEQPLLSVDQKSTKSDEYDLKKKQFKGIVS